MTTPDDFDFSKLGWEYYFEVDGLRKQLDVLRQLNSELRNAADHAKRELAQAQETIRQLEEDKAGIKRTKHYLRRREGTALSIVAFHRTNNGTHALCGAKVDPSIYELVELVKAPQDLCSRCNDALARMNRNQVKNTDSVERHNQNWFKKLTQDSNPAFNTWVYVFYAHQENRYKVGISTNVPSRYGALRHASGASLRVYYISPPCTAGGARDAERDVRYAFDRSRVAQEWYRLSHVEAKRVQQIIEERVMKDRAANSRKSA